MPAAITVNANAEPAAFAPESNRAMPDSSVAVWALGPRKFHWTVWPRVTFAVAGASPVSCTATDSVPAAATRVQGESSDVSPAALVAVAVTSSPAATATGSTTLNVAAPAPDVVAIFEPRYVRASPYPEGSHPPAA